MSNGLIGEDGTAKGDGLYNVYKKRSPNAYLKGTAKDYEVLVNAAINSTKSDRELADIMHDGNLSDDDISYVLGMRKKKRESEGSKSLYSTGQLQFPETKKLLDTKAEGDIRLTSQGIQYDIQKNDNNRKVIEGSAYNSFVKYEDMVKDILAEGTEYNNPNELFEELVNQDKDFQKEIAPYQNLINRVDLKIAEDLGIREKYEKELTDIAVDSKTGASGWAPMSGIQQLQDKYTSGSADKKSAFAQVFKEMQRQQIPFASQQRSGAFGEFFTALGARVKGEEPPKSRPTIKMQGFESEGIETDDPTTAISQIRDKYREKYGKEYSQVFQDEIRGKIPENYAESEFFLKQVEDAMHLMGSSVDLNGDNRIYQRGTAVGRAYNQFMLDAGDMVASTAAVVADFSGNEEFKKVALETKKVLANKSYLEGKVEYDEFNLNNFITKGEGTVTGLVNKSLGLTAKSLPYMMGIAGIQKQAAKKGLTVLGSQTLGKYTASTIGMGTISAATAYSDGMGQDWFEGMSTAGKLAYAGIHGLAEGAGETVSFAIFNKMFAPVLKAGAEPAKKTIMEFVGGGAKAFGWQVSEEILAESATAVVQSTAELVAKGEEVTYQKLKPRLEEAVEGAILMTATLGGTAGAVRAPFEVQNLHIARSIGFGDSKLRSRAKITALSEEYAKAKTESAKSVIGQQLAKALAQEADRNAKNAEFFEAVRKSNPEDHARLLEIADGFQSKVKQWNSMESGAAKQSLGAEIKQDFQEKLSIEEKYKDLTGEAAPVNATPEASSIAKKINAGENLTLDEENFYAENQAEVEEAVSSFGTRELYVPFEMERGKIQPTIEYEGQEGFLSDLINHFETVGESVFEGFKTTKENAIKGLTTIENAVKAIKKLRPDTKVFVHTNARAFKEATGLDKLSRGYFMKGNQAHFLAPAMVSNTGYHEVTHAAFGDVLGAKSYNKLFGDIADMVKESGVEGATAGQVIRNFIAGYDKKDQAEEAVVEFIAMLADGKFDVQIEKGILRQIAETIGNALGFEVPIPSRTQGVKAMKDIAESLRDGTPIDEDSVESLRERRDKGQQSREGRAQEMEDGNVMSSVEREEISNEAGKEQVITASAPSYSLNEVFQKTDGRVIVITSDNTGIGEVDGKDVMGGIGYSFLQENIRDGVGFASVNKEAVVKVKNQVDKVGNGQDVAILIMQQAPDGMLGNFYAADYLAEAITETFKNDRKQAATEIKERLMSLAPIKNSGELDIVEKFIDDIANGSKSEAVAEVVDKMTFPLRKAIVKSLLPKGYGKVKGVERINPNARVAVGLSKRMAEAGFSQVDFWRKYSSPETRTDEYIEGALNGDWGYTYSGFITNPNLDWGEDFQNNKGVTHPQFNAKLPSKETFKLDGGYQVDEAFKNLLTFGYNQEKGMYTLPPFGLKQSTSQSIFAGSFQKSTQEAVLELVTEPTTDPFNEFATLSSTPQGKAQIIGELGASRSHQLINKLELARDMEADGKDADNIFFATGWYRGADNQWRSEIRYGHIKKSFLDAVAARGKSGAENFGFALDAVIDSPLLYELYPSLKNYSFYIEKMKVSSYLGYHQPNFKNKDGAKGKIAVSTTAYFEEVDGEFKPKKGKMLKRMMNTIYHEIQHAVQTIEGVTDGYNERMIPSDVFYSKKRNLSTSKAQLKAVSELFSEMMELGEEQLLIQHRLLAYMGEALEMDRRVENAGKAMTDPTVYTSGRWISNFTAKDIQALAKLNPDEITEENFPNELIQPMLEGRNKGLSMFGDVTAFKILTEENFGNAEDALRRFKSTIDAAKYFVENGGIEALKLEQKTQKVVQKHLKSFDWAFSSLSFDINNPYAAIRQRADYLNRAAFGATVNISRYGQKEVFEGLYTKLTGFDVYQRNLGEAEARLVGLRGTTKLKNRAPLISELYPDVHNSEIWQIPPSSFYTKLNKSKKELKVEKERLADLKMDFDTALTQGLDKNDIDAVEGKVSDIEAKIKVFETKLDDALRLQKEGKAQLIEGTTEYELLKKEIQEEMIKNGLDNFENNQSYVNKFAEHFRFLLADKYRPLQNLQSAIEESKGRIERSETNFRRAEALMHGKAAEDARQFEEKMLKPLMDKMAEYGVTNEQISEYLYALHAYERNEFVKNTIDPANEAGSGMSNEAADLIKKKYEPNIEQMNELADMVYEITEESRQKMLDSGLISQAQYDSFKMFENYVPLSGAAVTPTSDLFDFTDSRDPQASSRGAGIAVFGKEYRTVTGRYSEARSPLETVVSNHLRTISRARKNETLQTLLKMVEENKNTKVWETFTEENPDMRVRVSKNGESIFIEEETGEEYEYQRRRKLAGIAMAGNPDYVPVKVDGKTTYIKFNDARITRAINNGGIGKTNAIIRSLNGLSRYLTRVFTSLNPEFIVANLTRDVQTALYNQMAEQNMELSNISGESFVTETLKGLPKAIQSVYRFETGAKDKMSDELREYYQDYLEGGAKTDWFFLKTPEQVESEMLKYIKSASPITSEASLREKANKAGMKIKEGTNAAFDFIDDLNTSIENGVRFSAYVSARREGVDADKAAEFAKELTINFNRSGEMGQFANSMYLFFNASVQGSTRLLRSVIKSKKARKVAAGMTAFSSMLTMYNIMAGGEDDEGIPYYDKISDYEKERFLIFMYGTEGKYLKLPLPYGLNMFFNAGTATAELALGASTPMDAAGFFFGSVVNSFSPISLTTKGKNPITTGFRMLMPTAIKPLAELGVNEDYLGNPIYVEQFPFGAKTPASSRYKRSTSEWSKTMAEFLNEATGGSEFVSGAIDVSPDAIEYFFKYYTGGAGKFVVRTGKTIGDVTEGKDVDVNNVPLARLFLATQRESEPAGRYYEYRKELLNANNREIGRLKSGESVTAETKRVNQLMKFEKVTQSRIKQLNKLQKQAEKIEDPKRREEALEKIYEAKMKAYNAFNGRYFKMKQK